MLGCTCHRRKDMKGYDILLQNTKRGTCTVWCKEVCTYKTALKPGERAEEAITFWDLTEDMLRQPEYHEELLSYRNLVSCCGCLSKEKETIKCKN